MINEETIKSLYNDKPTLLEWLKRVEAQLEELKKITNFDMLTANNAEINQKLVVKGNPVAKAIYVHRLTLSYDDEEGPEKCYISTKSEPYASLADAFADQSNTSLSYCEMFGSSTDGTFLLIFFGTNGSILFAVQLSAEATGSFEAIDISKIEFSKDEVVGRWNA